MIKDQIDSLLNQEMSRKEFLQRIGSGILIFIGVGGVLKALAGQQSRGRISNNGYGSSAYGGITAKR